MSTSLRGRRCEHEACAEKHFRAGLCLTHLRERSSARRCQIVRCKKPGYCRDMCYRHYRRWMRWGDPLYVGGWAPRTEGKPRTCDVKGCSAPHEARGWCIKHYHRWRTWGDPLYTARPGTTGPKPTPGVGHSEATVLMVMQLRGEGLSYGEIGKRMGITRDTAAGIYRRSTPCPTT